MCIAFLAVDAVPGYPLILAANRDEFYDRPTRAMAWWPDHPVLAGRDLKAGGAWLGLRRDGRLVVLTNYREPIAAPNRPSRGELVRAYLTDAPEDEDFARRLETEGDRYEGFNLVFGRLDRLFYYSNRGPGIRAVTPGLHGLCNHLLDTPWPKVETGLAALKALGDQPSAWSDQALFDILADQRQPPDEALPKTGIPLEWERLLAPMFVSGQDYGTRCATVIHVAADGRVTVTERTFNRRPAQFQSRHFQFQAPPIAANSRSFT